MSKILLLFDNVSSDYVTRISESASSVVHNSDHSIVVKNLHQTGRSVQELLDEHAPAGVILTPPYSDDRSVLSMLEERRIPFVRIAAMLDLERGCSVNMDELSASIAITKLLIEAGHTRVGFMRGPREHLVSIRRYNGYAGALGGARIAIDKDLVVLGDFSRQSGKEQAAALLRAKPTAIFASNDDMALGIIDAARARGISIPEDLSIVGFDDNTEAARANPPLTTVRQPLGRMGERAAEMVLERCSGATRSNVVEEVPFEVVERESVAGAA